MPPDPQLDYFVEREASPVLPRQMDMGLRLGEHEHGGKVHAAQKGQTRTLCGLSVRDLGVIRVHEDDDVDSVLCEVCLHSSDGD